MVDREGPGDLDLLSERERARDDEVHAVRVTRRASALLTTAEELPLPQPGVDEIRDIALGLVTFTPDDGVDRAQLRQQLAMTPEQRLASVVNLSRFVAEARRA